MDSHGRIEVDLFPEDVNSLHHPEIIRLKKLLEEVAEDYQCGLTSFGVERGTVTFSFDSQELTAEILQVLQYEYPDQS